jgi:hypothetical protein
VFNVSGSYFMIETDIFTGYPDTLLGSASIEGHYRPERGEYFIEHSKHVFPAVLRFYTHQEELTCPPCLPKDVFEVSRTLRRVQFLRHEWCLTMNVILFLLKR